MESNISIGQQPSISGFEQIGAQFAQVSPTSAWPGAVYTSTQPDCASNPYSAMPQYAAPNTLLSHNMFQPTSTSTSIGSIDTQTAALCAALSFQDLIRLGNTAIFTMFNELSTTKASLHQAQ
jgi:hypothetical protein